MEALDKESLFNKVAIVNSKSALVCTGLAVSKVEITLEQLVRLHEQIDGILLELNKMTNNLIKLESAHM